MTPGPSATLSNPLGLAGDEVGTNPHPIYAGLRENSPVLHVDGVGTLVSSWALVDEVLDDVGLFSSALTAGDLKNERPLIPLQIDPPEHRKFRRILDPLFSPKRMKQREGDVEDLVHRLIDGFAGSPEIDFVADFSVPFPSQVFLTMLGLPVAELPRFLAMKDGIIRPDAVVGKPYDHPEVQAHQRATARSIYDYFDGVIASRRGQGGDDLMSHFLSAEIDGERLSHDDILDICFLFLIAGLDTVSASLDCFFKHLIDNPALRRAITDDPDLVPAVVEELLRWETPVMVVPRAATRDTVLGGCPIRTGERVLVMLGAANTDGSAEPGNESPEFSRKIKRHFGFGGGPHRCLGSHLARVELQMALRVWHRRVPDYALKPGAELRFTTGVRAAHAFPMTLGPVLPRGYP
ncbi:cytochrome P450 [Mycolicibacterium palauense]|uniref:cytochrome P450 n=1 Tax=Mycolicibacterium palauense TaxID=2034511 RepID=UPI001FE5E408|nr:cytochrome P450 [Mycolicibacterium palauense]